MYRQLRKGERVVTLFEKANKTPKIAPNRNQRFRRATRHLLTGRIIFDEGRKLDGHSFLLPQLFGFVAHSTPPSGEN
jgi:hypothetical protein